MEAVKEKTRHNKNRKKSTRKVELLAADEKSEVHLQSSQQLELLQSSNHENSCDKLQSERECFLGIKIDNGPHAMSNETCILPTSQVDCNILESDNKFCDSTHFNNVNVIENKSNISTSAVNSSNEETVKSKPLIYSETELPLSNVTKLLEKNDDAKDKVSSVMKDINFSVSSSTLEENESKTLVYNAVELPLSNRKEVHEKSNCARSKDISVTEDVHIKHMYPDLKSIEYCENMQNILSLKTLVKTYIDEYFSKTITEANRGYHEFMMAISELDKYPLYDLAHEYQSAKKSCMDLHYKLKNLNSLLKRKRDSLWKSVKNEVTSKGKCEDGRNVIISHSYIVKEVDQNALEEVTNILRKLEEYIASDTFFSYSEVLMRLRIEQCLHNIIDFEKNSSCGFENHGILRKCISILFNFQRQPVKDKKCLETCQQWLTTLVDLLLQNGNLKDHLFILNHVLRCPNGIQAWASQFVQVPFTEDCASGNEDSFDCSCLQYSLLFLYLILKPVPDREYFLKNVKIISPSDLPDSTFTVLDSEGEEEEAFEVTRNWSDEDILSLLKQVHVARIYKHMLISRNEPHDNKNPSEERMMKVLAYSTSLIDIFFMGLETYCWEDFPFASEYICNSVRHILHYVSCFWMYYIKLNVSVKSYFQAEYDRFFYHALFKILKFPKCGTWKVLSTLSYKFVSKKMLWNILWIIHTSEDDEEKIYLEKDVDQKIKDDCTQQIFLEKVKSIDHRDTMYLLNAYEKIAISSTAEEEFLQFLVHEIFQISFVDQSLQSCFSKEGTILLSSIVKTNSHLLSFLLREIDSKTHDVVACAIFLFKEINLMKWIPKTEDITILSTWLLSNPLSNAKNHLARLILRKMNWEFDSEGKLILPSELHQKIAVLIVQAYMKFDTNGSDWIVSRGLTQMLQFATVGHNNSESHGFVPWAWELLFSLKLHILDSKFPPWVQIYDGFINGAHAPNIEEELDFQPLLYSYEKKHPVGSYLVLVMTDVGHSVKNLMVKGLDCLSTLVEHQQYAAAIHSLYYILPFFVKNSEQLLSQSAFITALNDLIVADMSIVSNITGGAVVGAVLHKIAAMIKHQIYQASQLTVECSVPLLKLWIKILLKVLSVQESRGIARNLRDAAKQVYFLLDVVIKISFLHAYTRDCILEIFYSFANNTLNSSDSISASFWSKMFNSNHAFYPILNKQTLPEYPWLAWCILLTELQQKYAKDLWSHVQKEMCKNENMSPVAALKKSSNFLKMAAPPLECLPIYRWSLQALEIPLTHPILPLFWQQFFLCYFEKIHIPNSQDNKSIGNEYFKSGQQFLLLKKIKHQFKQAEEYYRGCVENLTVTKSTNCYSEDISCASEVDKKKLIYKSLFYLKLFRAFSLWIDDKSLHLTNVCLSALEPRYNTEWLKCILQMDQNPWYDLISFDQIKEEIDQKTHIWTDKKCHNQFFEQNTDAYDESLFECLSRHLQNYEGAKPLVADVLHLPLQEVRDEAFSSWHDLLQSIEKDQTIIFEKAKSFTDLLHRLKQLNFNYINWIPQEFKTEDCEVTLSKTCYKGVGHNGCSGASVFKLQIKRHVRDYRIAEKIESNRVDQHMIQDQLLKLPVYDLCAASVHIENCIRAVAKRMRSATGDEAITFKNMGVSLFYHEIQAIDKIIMSVAGYSPSRQFFASSIETLGKEFIEGEEDQLLDLAKVILDFPNSGVLASHFFNPSISSPPVFLEVYKTLTSSLMKCSPSALLVLLSKVDLQLFLKEKNVSYYYRKEIFGETCKALLSCGCCPPDDILPLYDVFKKHFKLLLLYLYPELYADATSFLLNGMEKASITVDLWYEALHCFGCTLLHDGSNLQEIETAVRKFAQNHRLSPDQQIFVTIQPIHFKQVKETLEILHSKFMKRRNLNNDLYKMYKIYIKPFGIFLALLSHSFLSLLLEEFLNHRQVLSVSYLWDTLHLAFYPWLHPEEKGSSITFPWSDEEEALAAFLFKMFTMCLMYFHEQLMEFNCEKYILSYFWTYYVQAYVLHGYRHYSVSLCHTEFQSLPWHQFHPNADDIEGMCKVLQSNLCESKIFLSKIGLRIPWIDVMKNVSATKTPEYVGSTLGTLARLLIISGWDDSVAESNFHQNIFKSLETLPWHYLSVEDTEGLLNLYYTKADLINSLLNNSQHCPDLYILHFLKLVCGMATSANMQEYLNAKRLVFLRKYSSALTSCILLKKDTILKNLSKFKAVLPSLLKDIEVIICKEIQVDQQIHHALPLVTEVIGFLNYIGHSDLLLEATDSVVLWLTANPRSPLLLPCLKSSCCCLNSMETVVTLVECCINTRFNTGIQDSSEAQGIWPLISSCFQVSPGLSEEFVDACVKNNAYLSLYCYTLHRIASAESAENKKFLLLSIIDWLKRSKTSENSEAKSLLLWDKILELSIDLAFKEDVQIVQRVLITFCCELTSLGEDRSSIGFLAVVGLGRQSSLSISFRFLCRVIAAFILLQLPNNAPIRLEPMAPGYLHVTDGIGSLKKNSKSTDSAPSTEALKALENLKLLLDKKPYSALRAHVDYAVKCVTDPKNCLSESRQLLKYFAKLIFPEETFLYTLG